jgi:4,5-DOPA dioxygenase extradiol
MSATASPPAPVLFVGHGSPMNAIEDNGWSRGFRALGATIPRPRAILSISAHWYLPGLYLTGDAHPKTIHDFGGFPRTLFKIEYPAPGEPGLAKRVARMLRADDTALRTNWGLDHGTWSVLLRMLPEADCPVVQLSIDRRLSPAEHLTNARSLAPLRADGVLIMGSGNITHNLRDAMARYSAGDTTAPVWASRFDANVADAVEQRDTDYLIRAIETEDGRWSHPTPDHYLPLLYAMGAADANDALHFPITGFDLGSLSMRSALFA